MPVRPPSRRHILAGTSALLASAGLGTRASSATDGPKNLIVLFAKGGWDTTYSIDPKLGVDGIVGPEVDRTDRPDDIDAIEHFSGIPICVNPVRRPALAAFCSAWSEQMLVVNGVFNGSIGHDLARCRILTGTDDPGRPDLSVMYGVERGADLPIAAFDLSDLQFVGGAAAKVARLGLGLQVQQLIDPAMAPPIPPPGVTFPRWVASDEQETLLAAFASRRVETMRSRWGDGGRNDARFDDDLEASTRAARLRLAGRTIPLDGTIDIFARISLALDLLSNGVTRSILLEHGPYDSHYDTESQNGLADELFTVLQLLMDGLAERNLLDQTLVMVTSEMTRSPLLNDFAGKDHWPHTNAIFMGGGIVGGRVLGGTTDRQESLPIDLGTGERWDNGTALRYDELIAGVLRYLDVDPEAWLPGVIPWGGLGS